LIGKLKEGSEIFRKNFLSQKFSKEYLSTLDDESGRIVEDLKTGFSQNKWFHEIRNKVSFHYNSEEILGFFNERDDNETIEYHFSNYDLNNFSTVHSVLLHGMLSKMDSSDMEESVNILNREIREASSRFLKFLLEFIIFVIDKYLGINERNESIQIADADNKVEVKFWRFLDEENLKDLKKGIEG